MVFAYGYYLFFINLVYNKIRIEDQEKEVIAMPILGAYIVPHPPVIVPAVGQGREAEIRKTLEAYKEVSRRIAALKPETIIVITPHAVMYSDYIHISPGKGAQGTLDKFGAPEISIKADYDEELASALALAADEAGIPAGMLGEKDKQLDHGTLVPLYFISQNSKDYKLVRIASSGLDRDVHYAFGYCLKQVVEEQGRRVVLIASGDLSHALTSDGPYTFAEEGPIFDREITRAMAEGDFLTFLTLPEELACRASECGLNGFVIMAGALDETAVDAELLSYEGPFGVGYAVAAFKPAGPDQSRDFDRKARVTEARRLEEIKSGEDAYVALARLSLETFIKQHRTLVLPRDLPQNLPGELLSTRAGAFVTLKMKGRLRGCIGTTEPTEESLAAEIVRNAVSSGASDLRFPAVALEELPELVYSVDVLSPAEPILTTAELDVRRYGVIVTSGRKRGLLLPNLENVTTIEEQVAIALQKAGIPAGSNYSMARFEVVRHH
jgi:AmmeMemoRadiSam system protein A/AmmeMemoRadiSam system protein B